MASLHAIRARLVVLLLLLIPQVPFEIPTSSLSIGSPPLWTEPSVLAAAARRIDIPAQTGKPTPTEVTGDWVAQQIDRRDTGRDARSSMQMKLFDRQNRIRERTLTLLALENVDANNSGIGDRLLIRFNYPNDIAGTAFLVWERVGTDDERFLYLPALGRVRRIAGAERQESFVGSDFSYEDIGGRALEDYTYTLADQNASFAAPDGRSQPAWLLESRAKDTDARYPRVRSIVRKDNFVVVRAEIFNRRDEREKAYRVERLEQIQGIWTAMAVVMTNELARTRTEMTMTRVEYNVGLGANDFSRRELERGVR